MERIRRMELAAALGLLLALLCSFASYCAGCSGLRRDVVRLHVLANSDSARDQAVKLCVRDALLAGGSALFSGAATPQTAAQLLAAEQPQLEAAANRVLQAQGLPYTAHLTLEREFFTTRSYGSFTLPAGQYLAVKVILGAGQGHNWWCVMFPPLCLPAATQEVPAASGLNAAESAVLCADGRCEIRLKIVELFESWKEKVRRHYAGTSELPGE